MTVGQFIEWMAPGALDYFMRHLNHIWFEEACLNQETLCNKLNVHIDHLHCMFESYDNENLPPL